MEYKQKIFWRVSPGVCRCCLSEGCFKDISSEFFWIGEKEDYAEMLKECFGLELSIYEGIPKGTSRLICEVCIVRLRDASSFKKQVFQSEKQFVEFIKQTGRVIEGAGVLKDDVESVMLEEDIKMESGMKLEGSDEEFLDETLLFNDDRRDDKPVSGLKLEAGEVKISKMKSTSSKSSSEPTAKKVTTTRKVTATTSKPKKRGDKNIKTDRLSPEEKEKRLKIKVNAAIIIENTTVCPFKYFSNHFICPYCNEITLKSHEMRSHYLESHMAQPVKMIFDRLRKFKVIYVDITGSKCRHCSEQFEDLTNLKSHLRDKHGLSVDENYPDGVVPFFLGDNEWLCTLCKLQFSFFKHLCEHMNSHYENYICDCCGKGFLTLEGLRCHSQIHREGDYICKPCGGTFTSKLARDSHVRKAHPIKERYICSVCSLRFATYHGRLKHNKEVHGMGPEYKCPFCAITFPNQYLRKSHVYAEHKLPECMFTCDNCDKTYTFKNDLRNHMISHSSEKKHQCKLCQKRFKRHHVLVLHMRVHNDDRRYGCGLCDKRFIVKHRLQTHIRKRHQPKS